MFALGVGDVTQKVRQIEMRTPIGRVLIHMSLSADRNRGLPDLHIVQGWVIIRKVYLLMGVVLKQKTWAKPGFLSSYTYICYLASIYL